ncbi:MAG TPA: hypothetical protein VFX22_06590 [Candidatus Kapabacteria bacterium]|nr:hypothetical protein [Candidatus Kapabacteria bacterium]
MPTQLQSSHSQQPKEYYGSKNFAKDNKKESRNMRLKNDVDDTGYCSRILECRLGAYFDASGKMQNCHPGHQYISRRNPDQHIDNADQAVPPCSSVVLSQPLFVGVIQTSSRVVWVVAISTIP